MGLGYVLAIVGFALALGFNPLPAATPIHSYSVVGTSQSSGAAPVVPTLDAYPVMKAMSYATNGTYAVVESVEFSQTISVGSSTVTCGSAVCHQLHDAWANVSSPFPTIGTLLYSETWVNTTHACSPFVCPQGYFQCGESFHVYGSGPSVSYNAPCYASGILWLTGVSGEIPPLASNPTYNVTRLYIFEFGGRPSWIVAGTLAISTYTLTPPEPSVLGSLLTIDLTSWYVPTIALVVATPPWPWVASQSTFYWVNGTEYSNNWTLTSSSFVSEWDQFPTSYLPANKTDGALVSDNYTIALASLTGTPTWPSSSGSGNQSGPYQNATPPSSITLYLGNISTNSNGSETGYNLWSNSYSLPFNGTVTVTTPLLVNATVYGVEINGQPLSASQYVAGSGFIQTVVGLVHVAAGAALKVTVTFLTQSVYSPTSPVAVVNGYSINAPTLLMMAAVGFLLIYSVWKKKKLAFDVAAVGIACVAVALVLVG